MNRDNQNTPERMPKRDHPSFEIWSLIAFSIGTGILVLVSAFNLLLPSGVMDFLKVGIISASATLVSYAINRFAIEKGAELTATGFLSAGVVSVVSILAVGGGLFPSTYAGLVINEVDELQIHAHVSEQIRFVDARNKIAAQAARIIPAMRGSEAELIQLRDCELKESCLSGRGNGGRGSVTKALEAKARRASTLAAQLEAGETVRQDTLSKLNKLIGEFQKEFGQTDKSLHERRPALIRIDAEIGQAISALDEALPVSLLRAYAGELESGVVIANRPVATMRLNAILKKHAQGFLSVLSSLEADEKSRPVFPARAGVSTTFSYMGHFLPIAALTACIELIFPLTLWVYTLLGLIWRKHKIDPRPPHHPGDRSNRQHHNRAHRNRGRRNNKRGE